MKNWQFIVICILIISWFWVLYYQIHKYLEDIEEKQSLILWNTNMIYENSVEIETYLETQI